MSSSPSSSFENFLSIRTSCNRCRSQKLKCLVKPGSVCCQRCLRAMVPCVFSRRTRSRCKSVDSTAQKDSNGRSTAMVIPISADGHSDLPTAMAIPPLSLPDAQCPSNLTEGEINAFSGPMTPMTPSGAEIFSFDYNWNPDPAHDMLTLNRILESPAVGSEDGSSLGNMLPAHHNTINDHHQQLFANDMSLASREEGNNGELSFANYGNNMPSFLADGKHSNESASSNGFSTLAVAHSTLSSERANTTKALLNLAFNLEERLEALESGPWQQQGRSGTCQAALDSYPIGSVLHLSQEFTNIATALRQRRIRSSNATTTATPSYQISQSDSSEESMMALDSSTQLGPNSTIMATSSTSSSPYLDTSVTHILLSCYVTLSRIYFIVLGHFENYLALQPPNTTQLKASPTSSVDFGPSVCLGELPSINTPYSRTHTAICMLLDSLRQAEDALGLPPQIQSSAGSSGTRLQSLANSDHSDNNGTMIKTLDDTLVERDLAIVLIRWGLLTSATSIQDEFTALGKKVTDIKKLLREKMGL